MELSPVLGKRTHAWTEDIPSIQEGEESAPAALEPTALEQTVPELVLDPPPSLRGGTLVARVAALPAKPPVIPNVYAERYDLEALDRALSVLGGTQQARERAMQQHIRSLRSFSNPLWQGRIRSAVKRMQRAEEAFRFFQKLAVAIGAEATVHPSGKWAVRNVRYVRKTLPDGTYWGRRYADTAEKLRRDSLTLLQAAQAGDDKKVPRSLAYQGGMREARRFLARRIYHDIDMKNAFPSICRQLAAKLGIEVKTLDEYSSDRREAILADVMAHHQVDDRDDAKALFLSLLHGGSIAGWVRNVQAAVDTPHEFAQRYQADTRRLVDCVLSQREGLPQRIAQHRDTIAEAKRKKTTAANGGLPEIDRTLFANIIQSYEDRILRSVVDSLIRGGWTVGSLQFDGVYVEHREDADLAGALRVAEQAVVTNTGFSIELVEKELYEAEVDSVVEGWRLAHVIT